jgi:hypothetical protein
LRESILELGYNPVLSDHGDVGYLPTESAAESCYLALRDCQLVVMILGKRYGCISHGDISVTHHEFRTAREHGIPAITLVEHEVLSFMQVHSANATSVLFPGMDRSDKTFAFLGEVRDSALNNGVLPFLTVTEARLQLRRQLAHIMGDLLRRQYDIGRALRWLTFCLKSRLCGRSCAVSLLPLRPSGSKRP